MSSFPRFETLLKSRDVEDPVNLWLHRPLAYLFARAVYRTPMTPNQVTLLAMFVGVGAAVFFVLGPPYFAIGGVLLWASSILDGADGILARAKKMSSDVGRALDGTADGVVAGTTVFAVVYQIWITNHRTLDMVLVALAIPSAMIQIYLYDYYKEIYMRATREDNGERRETIESLTALRDEKIAAGAPLVVRFAINTHISLLKSQEKLIRLLNPRSLRLAEMNLRPKKKRFVKHHRWPMRLWSWVSLCPHTYLMAISAILGRLDLYIWYRVVVGNTIFLVVLVWQRFATSRMLDELEADTSIPPTNHEPMVEQLEAS